MPLDSTQSLRGCHAGSQASSAGPFAALPRISIPAGQYPLKWTTSCLNRPPEPLSAVLLQLPCVIGSLRAPNRPGDLFPLIPLISYKVYGDLARNSTRDLFASLEADLCASCICIGSTGPLLVSNRRQPVLCSRSHLVSSAMDRAGRPRFKRRRRSRVTKTRRDPREKKECR
ncbi:hypothetical protein IG631_10159 [Alternaria alternata]|nr:hypothetical protein IG631_10159 [Alternaria alternata]